MPRGCRRAALTAVLLVLVPAARAGAWGFTAHRIVNARAIRALPPPLRALFEANAAYVAEHAVDPDLWRAAGRENEDPAHFLDLDAFGSYPFAEIPHVEADHLARHGAKAGERGRVPWRTAEVYRELVEAFRARDPQRILERASILGHYVGDAHVPLHAVLNYDGQLSGQAGLHSRWERELVERFERQLEPALRSEPARPLGDPVEVVFEALLESYLASAPVLEADRGVTSARDLAETPEDERYDDSYYSRFYEREHERLAARLSLSAFRVGSLWLQAWQQSGRPALDASFRIPYVRRGVRGILVSLDGAAVPVLDDAVRRGVMPNLARLRASGASARGARTSLPSKTAAGHAALFTAAWSDVNGIAGNEVPVPGASVLEWNTGYSSTHLSAEPIWVSAARQGLNVTVVSAPQAYPFGPFQEEKRFGGHFGRNLTLFEGYQNLEASERVWSEKELPLRPCGAWVGPLPRSAGEPRELELNLEGVRIDGLAYDDPADPAAGFDTLLLALDRDPRNAVRLKPRPALGANAEAFAGLTLRLAGAEVVTYFRLFELAADGSHLLLYQAAPHPLRSNRQRLESASLQATGGFVGNGAWIYDRGALGKPLWDGGDGTAERRYLETVALVTRQFTRLTEFALEHTSWELLLTYLPYPDETLHLWLGWLDPSLPGHDPALAARLRPFLDEVLRSIDGFVGRVAEHARSGTVLAVAGDHGMSGASRVFKPNVALAESGLLSLNAQGEIDLAKTRAVYFPGNSGFVLINRDSRPGGVVKPADEAEVRRAAEAALRRVRDEGRPVVQDVLDARAARDPRLGGPEGGDLYLSLAPGYDLSGSWSGERVESLRRRGVHITNPERPEMQVGFAIAGPGVAAGRDLGVIAIVDIVPTLSALLGIEPPASAAGRVLEQALAHPRPSSGEPAATGKGNR